MEQGDFLIIVTYCQRSAYSEARPMPLMSSEGLKSLTEVVHDVRSPCFSMGIPSGALVEPVTITVVAKKGPYVAYEMLPHGLRFLKPVTAVQGLRTTAAYGTDAGSSVRSAYLPEGSESVDADDSSSPSE